MGASASSGGCGCVYIQRMRGAGVAARVALTPARATLVIRLSVAQTVFIMVLYMEFGNWEVEDNRAKYEYK